MEDETLQQPKQPEEFQSQEPIHQSQSVTERLPVNNQRLVISHIENVNFKSYAGKQVLGPFHKCFSSIVGPNGSGKSNVIDAMLFVFGYRSKKIRSKKISLLIHNSENHQNIDSCTVKVFFQKIIDLPGDDEFEIVANSQFTVARTARKDGSSDYYLNDRKQSFKEIGTVLRACGIDLDHNRFLILQGEVEQISLMKPKAESEHDEGMLEYLEDIIGTNCYKEPIENAEKAVEELNERRGEKLNRAKAVEKERNELEGEKNEATEFLTMENKITKKNHLLYQKYIYDCAELEQKSIEKQEAAKKNLDELQEKLKVFVDQKKDKGNEYKKINKLFEKLVEEAEEKKKAFAEFEKVDLKIREDLKHRKKNKKQLDKNLDAETKKFAELKDVPKNSQAEIEKCDKSLEQLEKQKETEEERLNEIMAGLKGETEEMQQEKEVKEHELMEKQKVVNEAKSKLDVASSELEVYLSGYNKLKDRYEQAKEKLSTVKTQKEEKQREIKNIEDDLPASKKALPSAEKDLHAIIEEETKLANKIKKNRAQVEESRVAMHASQSRNAVQDALMAEKKRGNLKGLYGRLGDLGGIDKKYDIAISTACGALDHMVVDRMDTAQRGVEFLKKNNIGSTTFVALDKIQYLAQRAKEQKRTPENVKRLYDLVQVKDQDVKIAFYHALKDTLVADNLDQATRIAYPKDPKGHRWRVVTLKGELIEVSGTMSGGGNKPVQGRIGCRVVEKVDRKVVEKQETDLNYDIEKLEDLREKKSTLEDNVHRLHKEIKGMEHQYQKLKMEIQALITQESELVSQIKELEQQVKQSKPDPKHQKKMEKDIEEFEKTFKKASDSAGKIEKEVQSLHKKIMEIGKTKLSGQQAKVDSVNKLIDEVTQKKTKASVGIKTAARNIKKSEEKIESLQNEIEENNEAIKNIEEVELNKLEDQATEVLAAVEEGKNKMREMQSERERLREAFEATNEEETKLKENEIKLKFDHQTYENLVKENHGKVAHWKKELSNLSLHKIRTSVTSDQTQPPQTSTVEEFKILSPEELEEVDREAITYEITVLTTKLEAANPNMAAIADYFKKEEAYIMRVKELEEVTDARNNKRKEYDDLRKQRLDEFMQGFSVITTKLKEMYQMITLGGDAELELVDSLDPFSEGIVFSVRPPNKSWKNISNLSGGEKTLSSLALVFALHHYKPSPLYVMDEIDAALDFKNVSIIANYIKERTKNAQFIIISLRNNMFELADRLVGIYKTDNCTKSVVVCPSLIEEPVGR
ncbi:structural maintenance of chromosomes protein 4-like [Clytia hemisphaerica]|uniref:Structural maintenance of chromosomes protein n=1 Tax=Clytia hemisphaerica TaxID=252671 RepID=A0A7M5VCQ8_9CNID